MCGLAVFFAVMFLLEAIAVALMSRLMARGRKREKDWKILVDTMLTQRQGK
jgi:Na+-transporting methylmalonyl-CoA/oxaloacetate decarboxylase gamma subunit